MTAEKTRNKDGFYTLTCGRCGGSGHYSFNLMHGTTCYGCGGSGVVFTAAAKKAREFLRQSRMRKVEDIRPGDFVRLAPGEKWRKVERVEAPDGKHGGRILPDGTLAPFGLLVAKGVSMGFDPGQVFESVRDAEEQKATLAAALAYQDTLE